MQERWIKPAGAGSFGDRLMYYFDAGRGQRRRRRLFNRAGYKDLFTGRMEDRLGERVAERVAERLDRRLSEGSFDEHGVSGKRPSPRKLARKRGLSGLASPGYFTGRAGGRFDGYADYPYYPAAKAALSRRRAGGRNRWFRFAILGAALIYYFDPQHGRSRRSRIRDKFVHFGNVFQTGTARTGHDIGNRTRGALASFRNFFSSRSREVNDEVLAQRVRSQLGHIVSNPRAIEVEAQDGRVILSGPAMTSEIGQMIMHVYAVRGVKEVENRLDSHDEPGRIPGLQGARPFRSASGFFGAGRWSPAARAVAGTLGALTFLYGVGSRRGRARIIPAVAGSLLTARAISNMELSRLTGIGARRRAIDLQKTIHINAPVQRVFALWSDFENFPAFMSHVRQVRRLDGESGRQGRLWRWTVDGPAGTKVEFDAGVIGFKDNRLIAWSTDRSSPIQHLGRVEFNDLGDGSTRVTVRMSYNPIAGALGHAVARFFGADPKRQMNDDLTRMKSFIETGKVPHDAAAQKSAAKSKQGAAARSG